MSGHQDVCKAKPQSQTSFYFEASNVSSLVRPTFLDAVSLAGHKQSPAGIKFTQHGFHVEVLTKHIENDGFQRKKWSKNETLELAIPIGKKKPFLNTHLMLCSWWTWHCHGKRPSSWPPQPPPPPTTTRTTRTTTRRIITNFANCRVSGSQHEQFASRPDN